MCNRYGTSNLFKRKKKEMNVVSSRIGIVIKHRSVDRNPSSPRVSGYGQGCPVILWHLTIVKFMQRQGEVYCHKREKRIG
jgi:hypothetical protein